MSQQLVMHVKSYSLNGAGTSLKLRYDPNYPTALELVTVNSDTTVHGAIDVFDPTDITAVVYVPGALFNSLLSDLRKVGYEVVITLTCDDENNVTGFTEVAQLKPSDISRTVTDLHQRVTTLSDYIRRALPVDLHERLLAIESAVSEHAEKRDSVPPASTGRRANGAEAR